MNKSNIEPKHLASRLDDNIWISGHIPSKNKTFLKRFNITRILRLYDDEGKDRFPEITYLVFPCEDKADYDMTQHFKECMDFIGQGIRKNENILIHCHAGISRSATICLVYLMYKHHELLTALSILTSCRNFVCPNDGFVKQLISWRYGKYGEQLCLFMHDRYHKFRNLLQEYYAKRALRDKKSVN